MGSVAGSRAVCGLVPVRRTLAGSPPGCWWSPGRWSWSDATRAESQFVAEGEIVTELGAQVAEALPDDEVVRIERRGEPWHIFTPGLIYDLIDRGVRVTTTDGEAGLKWGHEHRWFAGERYDRLLTVAVHNPGSYDDAVDTCMRSSSAELIASYDALTAEDRDWLEDYQLRRLEGEDAVTEAEVERGGRLEAADLRIGVFDSPLACAADQSLVPDRGL